MEKTGFASVDKPWLEKIKYDNEMPNVNMTAYDYLYEANKNNLNDVALIYDALIDMEPTKITYKELFKLIDECSRSYIKLGIKKGDIVTVSLPSCIENIVSFYALNRIGAISNLIHPQVSQEELEFYLEEAESKILLGYGNIKETLEKIEYNKLKKVVIVDLKDNIKLTNKIKLLFKNLKNIKINSNNNPLYISFKNFMKIGKTVKDVNVNHNGSLTATLTHTSGTSGKSKAVMTNSIAFNSSVSAIVKETNLFMRHDKELLALPPFPLYILNNGVHLALSRGIELIVVPQVDYDNISIYFKKYKLNHLKGIPFIIEKIEHDKGFDDVDLKDFKFLISGGGKLLNEKEINIFLKKHNCKYSIANGYGMSEVGGCATCMFDNTEEINTVGRPLIGYNAKIMSLDGKEELKYTENNVGEIWLTGPGVMQKYYKNDEATKEIMQVDGNVRWVKTGDLGQITENGNLKVIGRIKRMTFIFDPKTNTASKVSHDYVENSLCENENVLDSIVVAQNDKKTQNVLKAYIVVKDSPYEKVVEDLDKLCKTRFRKHVAPVEYIVVDNIPKTSAGKDDYRYVESFNNGNAQQVKMKVLYRKEVK